DRRQAIRKQNFEVLRDLIRSVDCVEPLTIDPRVRAHGMYMFAMRYKPDRCAGVPLHTFLDLVQAEGAPIHRAFAATMSDQPAIQQLMERRPQYFRRLSTPVADRAASEVIYIAQCVFRGAGGDIEDSVVHLKRGDVGCEKGWGYKRGHRRGVYIAGWLCGDVVES